MPRLNIPIRCFGDDNPVSNHVVEATPGLSDAEITAYLNAVLLLTEGINNQVSLIDEIPKDAATAGVVPAGATRGKKWRCKYQDNVDGSISQLTIPAADETLLGSGRNLDLTAGDGLTFKTAFEATVVSKGQPGTGGVGGGNAVTLLEVKFITVADSKS